MTTQNTYGLTHEQIDAIDAVLTMTTLRSYQRRALSYIVAEYMNSTDMEDYAATRTPPMFLFKDTSDIHQFAMEHSNLVDGDEYERLERENTNLTEKLKSYEWAENWFSLKELSDWQDRVCCEIQAGRKDYAIQMLEAFALEGKMI
jgi:hypothetical protein